MTTIVIGPGWIGPSAAGRRLGCSVQWVRRLLSEGRLRGTRTALGWLIDPESVDELLAARASSRTVT